MSASPHHRVSLSTEPLRRPPRPDPRFPAAFSQPWRGGGGGGRWGTQVNRNLIVTDAGDCGLGIQPPCRRPALTGDEAGVLLGGTWASCHRCLVRSSVQVTSQADSKCYDKLIHRKNPDLPARSDLDAAWRDGIRLATTAAQRRVRDRAVMANSLAKWRWAAAERSQSVATAKWGHR